MVDTRRWRKTIIVTIGKREVGFWSLTTLVMVNKISYLSGNSQWFFYRKPGTRVSSHGILHHGSNSLHHFDVHQYPPPQHYHFRCRLPQVLLVIMQFCNLTKFVRCFRSRDKVSQANNHLPERYRPEPHHTFPSKVSAGASKEFVCACTKTSEVITLIWSNHQMWNNNHSNSIWIWYNNCL